MKKRTAYPYRPDCLQWYAVKFRIVSILIFPDVEDVVIYGKVCLSSSFLLEHTQVSFNRLPVFNFDSIVK